MHFNRTMQELSDTGAVIDALGGTVAVAKMTHRAKQQVSFWRRNNVIPAKFYPLMREALERAGKQARKELWGIVEAA